MEIASPSTHRVTVTVGSLREISIAVEKNGVVLPKPRLHNITSLCADDIELLSEEVIRVHGSANPDLNTAQIIRIFERYCIVERRDVKELVAAATASVFGHAASGMLISWGQLVNFIRIIQSLDATIDSENGAKRGEAGGEEEEEEEEEEGDEVDETASDAAGNKEAPVRGGASPSTPAIGSATAAVLVADPAKNSAALLLRRSSSLTPTLSRAPSPPPIASAAAATTASPAAQTGRFSRMSSPLPRREGGDDDDDDIQHLQHGTRGNATVIRTKNLRTRMCHKQQPTVQQQQHDKGSAPDTAVVAAPHLPGSFVVVGGDARGGSHAAQIIKRAALLGINAARVASSFGESSPAASSEGSPSKKKQQFIGAVKFVALTNSRRNTGAASSALVSDSISMMTPSEILSALKSPAPAAARSVKQHSSPSASFALPARISVRPTGSPEPPAHSQSRQKSRVVVLPQLSVRAHERQHQQPQPASPSVLPGDDDDLHVFLPALRSAKQAAASQAQTTRALNSRAHQAPSSSSLSAAPTLQTARAGGAKSGLYQQQQQQQRSISMMLLDPEVDATALPPLTIARHGLRALFDHERGVSVPSSATTPSASSAAPSRAANISRSAFPKIGDVEQDSAGEKLWHELNEWQQTRLLTRLVNLHSTAPLGDQNQTHSPSRSGGGGDNDDDADAVQEQNHLSKDGSATGAKELVLSRIDAQFLDEQKRKSAMKKSLQVGAAAVINYAEGGAGAIEKQQWLVESETHRVFSDSRHVTGLRAVAASRKRQAEKRAEAASLAVRVEKRNSGR